MLESQKILETFATLAWDDSLLLAKHASGDTTTIEGHGGRSRGKGKFAPTSTVSTVQHRAAPDGYPPQRLE